MPNNCLSVLYKHIIQVENENVGLKVCVWGGWGVGGGRGGGTNIPLPPRFLRQCNIIVMVNYNSLPRYLLACGR